MRIERVSMAEIERLGGPSGVAAHLRALVPDGDSVEVSVEELTGFLPERLLNADEADRVANGRPVTEPFDVPPAHVRLTYDGRLVAVARVDGENLRPEVVLT